MTLRITKFLIIILVLVTHTIMAQQKAPVLAGRVTGMLMDTVNNYAVQAATVSIYKVSENNLLNYQITNNYGEFSIKNLPIGTPLKLVVTSIGYASLTKAFTISDKTHNLDLMTLNMDPSAISLETITVSVPPITMNGDTLEFNAAAFKLDSNAVVEDMLRKLDNVTLWGDGKITVNGKEIKSLLVNGKSFFGNDAKIALQNIPKNDVQKIQVYNKTDFNPEKPLDSVMEMNLKLKKGVGGGYFGKIGFGYGTNKRYETDISLNLFTSKMQLSVVGASNNINKLADNSDVLIENSTFKGVGTNVNYQPDFKTYGINRPNTVGLKFNYNFLDKPDSYKNNVLNANYFRQDVEVDSISNFERTTSLSDGTQIFDKNKIISSTKNILQKFNSDYELLKNEQYLHITNSITTNSKDNSNSTLSSAENGQHVLTSTNNSLEESKSKTNNFVLTADYIYPSKSGRKFGGLTAKYNININNIKNNNQVITNFKSLADTSLNKSFNRNYDTKTENINQLFDFELPNLRKLILGSKQILGFNFSVSNSAMLNIEKNNNHVYDADRSTGNYIANEYLTNITKEYLLEDIPGINFTKVINKNLSDRYSRRLIMRYSIKQLFANQRITSLKDFQNINRNYSRFVPEAQINYKDQVYGEYARTYSMNYTTDVKIPNLRQIAPLTDSTDVYRLLRGNRNLKEEVQRQISVNFSHEDESSTNSLNYMLNLKVGQISSAIADSILIDNQNRQTIYKVNVDGKKYAIVSGEVKKAFKLKDSEVQISINPVVEYTKYPIYLNSVFAVTDNLNSTITAKIYYRLKNLLTLEAWQFYSAYKTKQSAFANLYSGNNNSSTLSSSFNINKRFTIGTNITFNRSSALGSNDINYTIWNANTVYRFLKGNNLEFKFSALDLLKQNNSVVNFSDQNSFVIGTRNVLQHYFMATVSYYPRHFGKKAGKK